MTPFQPVWAFAEASVQMSELVAAALAGDCAV
jgi:hypothetical protein